MNPLYVSYEIESAIREECQNPEGNDEIICEFPYGLGTKAERDRAEFIVRACNSHDDLVAALRAILREANHSNDPDFDDIKDIAEAALAKASAP